MSPVHLLIVDDNDVDRERIHRFLGARFATTEARTAAGALELSKTSSVDCVLLDYRLPDRDGTDLIEELTAREIPVIMLTGQGDEQVAVEAMKRGARDYLVKGAVDARSLHRAVANAIEQQRLRRRIEAQQEELEAQVAELDRRRLELESSHRALAEREAKLSLILRQLPVVVWTTDEKLRYTSMSGLGRVTGIDSEDTVGRSIGDALTDAPAKAELVAAHRAALSGEAHPFELAWGERVFQGRVEPLRDDVGAIGGAIGAAFEITETRRLERHLQRSQRMEALGTLAGGVAHDFNNILTVILSFAGFAKDALGADHPAAEDLDEVLNAAHRGADLVRQLLAFSRHRPIEPRVVDVNVVLRSLVPMMRRLLGADVELQLDTAEDLWSTRIDPGGLEQIVVNLAVNARDAMRRGGRVFISTQNLILEEALPLNRRAGLSGGSYVVLAVSDEGVGISRELQEKIFEPFFTTKEVGHGTGLGLATCWGIAQQAGGAISVYSEPGHGATFKVFLPGLAERADASDLERLSSVGLEGNEVVLVVEDDARIRALTGRALRAYGYQVLEAGDGSAAEEHVAARADEIQLLIVDVVMPGQSGPELVTLLRPRLPRARVLYTSGYTGAAIRQRGLLEDGARFLEKPFTPEVLARKVRSVLDSR